MVSFFQHKGQTCAIPQDTHVRVLYYNKALVARTGLAGAAGNLKPIEDTVALAGAFRVVKKPAPAHTCVNCVEPDIALR